MWHKRLNQHWNKTKSFIHQGYQKLGKWAGEVDRGAGIMRKMFSLATPMLDDFGGGDIIRKGLMLLVNMTNSNHRYPILIKEQEDMLVLLTKQIYLNNKW